MSATTIGSIWVDGAGCTVPANDTEGLRSQDDRIDAVDRRGWIHLRSEPEAIELWVNPLCAEHRTVCAAVEILRGTSGDRPLVVRVHDRGSRGSLIAESVDQLPELIRESVGLTSRPVYPLSQDRLSGCLPTEINDPHVQDMWRFLVANQFAASEALVDRVLATEGRAKLVSVCARRDTVRYLAHDRRTADLWKHPAGFAGRALQDIPIPAPLKRSVSADLTGMLRDRQVVVSFVRGLRRVMKEEAPVDSFFRVSIPLRRQPGTTERPALVLLSPYA